MYKISFGQLITLIGFLLVIWVVALLHGLNQYDAGITNIITLILIPFASIFYFIGWKNYNNYELPERVSYETITTPFWALTLLVLRLSKWIIKYFKTLGRTILKYKIDRSEYTIGRISLFLYVGTCLRIGGFVRFLGLDEGVKDSLGIIASVIGTLYLLGIVAKRMSSAGISLWRLPIMIMFGFGIIRLFVVEPENIPIDNGITKNQT